MLRLSRKPLGVLLAAGALVAACGGRLDSRRETRELAPDAGTPDAVAIGGAGSDAGPAGGTLAGAVCADHVGPTCDPAHDCGCPIGQTCSFALQDRVPVAVCRAVSPAAVAPYSLCDNDAECPAAHSCLEGICRKACATESDCGWPGAACLTLQDGSGNEIKGWRVCSRHCDPVSPEQPAEGFQACGPGIQCHPFDSARSLDCTLPIASAAEGSGCFDFHGCAPGLECVEGRCTRWCEVGGTDCAPGTACSALEPQLSIGGREFGTCACVPASGALCDPVSGCGCSANQSCRLDESLMPSCRNVSSEAVGAYEPCGSDESCPPQHSCSGGVCKQHCATADDCGWPGATCEPLLRGSGTVEGWNVCTRHCDPLSPQSPRPGFLPCGRGAQCSASGNPAHTDCFAPAGNGGGAAGCARDEDCLPGYACGSRGVCEQWCDLAHPTCADASTECSQTSPPTLVDGIEFGSCGCAGLSGACDLTTSCGCRAGDTCGFGPLGVAECRSFSFGDTPYSACSDSNFCPDLHSCVNGVCVRQCKTPADCDVVPLQCLPVLDATGAPIADFRACTRFCDLESPVYPGLGFEDCSAGQCIVLKASDGSSPAVTDCRVAGSGGAEAPCSTANDCQGGFFCADGSCRRWCRVGADQCGPGLTCTSLDPPVVLVDNLFGACTPD